MAKRGRRRRSKTFVYKRLIDADLDTVLNRYDKKIVSGVRSSSQGGGGLLSAVEMGVKLGKAKGYKRMGALGAKGHYKANPRPWDTGTYKKSSCIIL